MTEPRQVGFVVNEGHWTGTYRAVWPEGCDTLLDVAQRFAATFVETLDGQVIRGTFICRVFEPPAGSGERVA